MTRDESEVLEMVALGEWMYPVHALLLEVCCLSSVGSICQGELRLASRPRHLLPVKHSTSVENTLPSCCADS